MTGPIPSAVFDAPDASSVREAEEQLSPHYEAYMDVTTDEYACSLRYAAVLESVCAAMSAESLVPLRVLDIGSGFSTFVSARAGAVVDSYDHDPKWARATERFIQQRGVELDENWRIRGVQKLVEQGPDEQFDLISHDVGDMKRRLSMLPLVWKALRPGGALLLDDMHKTPYGPRAWAWLSKREGVEWVPVYDLTVDRFLRYAWLVYKRAW